MTLNAFKAQQERHSHNYGQTLGQLGAMKAAGFDSAISSPPYADAINQNGEGPQGAGDRHGKISPTENAGKNIGIGYGTTPGQLGAMKATGFDSAISSPPYSEQFAQEGGGIYARGEHTKTIGGQWLKYGDTEGNVGQLVSSDFWSASRVIVEQVYQVLKPGGHAIWVVKAFVKNKQCVDFPGQWQALCEAVGFTTLHEHHAMLVKHMGTQIDLMGNANSRTVERKSFFRRLAEKKGSPRIDYEVVLCMVKP